MPLKVYDFSLKFWGHKSSRNEDNFNEVYFFFHGLWFLFIINRFYQYRNLIYQKCWLLRCIIKSHKAKFFQIQITVEGIFLMHADFNQERITNTFLP